MEVIAAPIVKRKRRTKQEIATAAAAAAATSSITLQTEEVMSVTAVAVAAVATAKVKPASKKKSTQPTIAVVTRNGIQGSFDTFTKVPLIAHLDIKSSDVVFYDQPFHYNPDMSDLLKEPEPYDALNEDVFVSSAEPLVTPGPVAAAKVVSPATGSPVTPAAGSTATTEIKRKDYAPQNLLVSFASSHMSHTLPDRSDVFCFWCCHAFEGRPCIIPQACEDGVWKVYGNFCSPSCSLSYLLSQVMDTHIRWERIALMNRLYGTAGRVYPAPARETLTTFGGTFSINEFRHIIDERRLRVDITIPPMVSILASMDTKPIDFYETSIKNTIVGGGAYARVEEGLKLRRSKPLKDRESTLDSVLNISIKTY